MIIKSIKGETGSGKTKELLREANYMNQRVCILSQEKPEKIIAKISQGVSMGDILTVNVPNIFIINSFNDAVDTCLEKDINVLLIDDINIRTADAHRLAGYVRSKVEKVVFTVQLKKNFWES